MTNTSVKGVNPYALNQNGKTMSARGNGDAFTDCFAQICSRSQEKLSADSTAVQTNTKTVRTDESVQKKTLEKEPAQTEETMEAAKPEETEENLSEQVDEAAAQMMAEIAAQLGISPEQVMEAMQELDMSPEDLLNADQITELMVAIAGEGNEASLLTDETLYQSVKEVTQSCEEVFKELSEKTGLDEEALKDLIAKLSAESKKAASQPETAEAGIQILEKEVKPAAENRMPVIEIQKTDSSVQKTDTDTVQETQPVQEKDRAESGKNAQNREQKGQESGSYLQQTDGLNAKMEALTETSGTAFSDVDTEQIMKQIMDYMKVQIKADMTQMEIQLHPASLGNIHIQIAAKNGEITAQFTAQNEAVKTALESQIVQLKESLNEQGIKVEAVEVAIASHEFERNLEQNQSDGQRQDASREKKGGRRINLNLTGLEDTLTDEMEEADRIAADMMVRNGNTVDFSA